MKAAYAPQDTLRMPVDVVKTIHWDLDETVSIPQQCTVHLVPGTHRSLLNEPHAGKVAQVIDQILVERLNG